MSHSSEEEHAPEPMTVREFLRIMQEGTEEELQRALKAMSDPHSPLLDAIEKFESWAQGKWGYPSNHQIAGDDMLSGAAARSDRRAILSFAMKLIGEKRIDPQTYREVLAAGSIDTDNAQQNGVTIATAVKNMTERLLRDHPELQAELDKHLVFGKSR